ncbi:LacI family DNA-binding transcriptional regulator [Vibrio viridaestus]|uniref:LacI family transcriptional regulator n=1 Tax=Vibrio viridaestus TaxID=2487322 RepID=A0A3N9TD22_9VIBR|nr:LacI family DNA-binding transcriptional regulator [Vibrio viridaestus]RQW62061.1 LacI family transcriptional regulator [Vibrio viridaestus]
MSTTIKDIANALGISHSTVSRALNNSQRVQASTRELIFKTAHEMNYVPNAAARDMKKNSLPVLGVVTFNMGRSAYGSEMIGVINQQARKMGYQLIYIHVEDGFPSEDDYNILRERRVSGLIFVSLDPDAIEHNAIFDEIKTVFVNCYCERPGYSSVQANNIQGLFDITHYSLQHGYNKTMFINLESLYQASRDRKSGYQQALMLNNHDFEPDKYIEVPVDFSFDFNTLDSQIQAAIDDGVDVILCGRDEIALEVYFTLARLGLSIPDDIAVIGFDNQSIISQRVSPKLTTVELPYQKMARQGVQLLLRQQNQTEQITINCEPIFRGSMLKK